MKRLMIDLVEVKTENPDVQIDTHFLDPILTLEEVEIKQEDDLKEQYLSEEDFETVGFPIFEVMGGGFTPEKSLRKHQENSSKKFLHTCEICGLTVRYRHEFTKHMRQHSKKNDKPVDQCQKCSKKFYFRGKIERHVCISLKSNCYYCNLECCSKKSVIRHIDKMHRTDGYFPCPFEECKAKKLTCAKTIYYHLESHYDPVNLICSICGRFFSDRNLYWGHSKMHRDKNR